VTRALASARLVLANSAGTEARAKALGATNTRVVHLGTDVPPEPAPEPKLPTIATVGHLVARKRHADVLRALWLLRDAHPDLRWVVAGDGPERPALERLATELALGGKVKLLGQLPPAEARAAAQAATVFALPSVDEAFGVAYIEAMAAGVPAIGCLGEDGPEEIAASGPGIRLVAPGDPEGLAAELRALLDDAAWRRELGDGARATVQRSFTWEACGLATVAAYEEALR
jgi:glycosyltransferase involved in cell wall biosynthesis